MLLSKVLFDVNSVTQNPNESKDKGILGDAYNNFTEDFKLAIMDSWNSITKDIHSGLASFGETIIKGLVQFLSPIVEWGCKSFIAYCVIIYYCTDGQDKKSVKMGITAIIIFILFEYIKGWVL